MTLRRRGLVGCGRRPTVDERGAYNVQAAGSTAQLTGVCYRCSARRQVSFASVHQRRRRRARLHSPIQTHVFEDARNDAAVGNESNHLQLAATIGTPAQINSEYTLEAGHPAHRRTANIGLAFIVTAHFDGDLGASHDVCSLSGVRREYPVVTYQMGFGAWHQRCQSGDEVMGLEQYVGGAVTKRSLQLSVVVRLTGVEWRIGDDG
jgi:hypothetical protein